MNRHIVVCSAIAAFALASSAVTAQSSGWLTRGGTPAGGTCQSFSQISGTVTAAAGLTNGIVGPVQVGETYVVSVAGPGTGTFRIVGDPAGMVTYAGPANVPASLSYTVATATPPVGAVGVGYFFTAGAGTVTITASLVQLRRGCLWHLPRLWPRHRRGLRPGHPDENSPCAGAIKPIQTPAWKECQDDYVPPRRDGGHPARHTLEQAHCRAETLGHRRHTQLQGRQLEQAVVIRHPPLLCLPGEQGLQNAHPVLLSKYRSYTPCPVCGGARLQLESLLGASAPKTMPTPCCHPRSASCRRCGLVTGPAEGPAGPVLARPDAAAHRTAAALL